MPIVGVLVFLSYRNYKRASQIEQTESVLLVLEIPKANEKQELAAEQLFASLHGILRDKKELVMSGGLQEHISFEIAAIGKHIRFYVWVPKHLQNFLEGQIYAQYPTVQIHRADEDYARREVEQPVVFSGELVLTDNEVLPIKTFQSFEVDPLAGITATLAKLDQSNEEMWIQVMARPIADDWHRRASRYVSSVKNGGGAFGGDLLSNLGIYLLKAIEALWQPPQENGTSAPKELSEREKTRISEVEKKSTKLGYQVKIRMVYLGTDQVAARQQMQAIVGTFKQFNSTNLNGFTMKKSSYSRDVLAEYVARLFIDKGYILNIEELASVFHLPHTNVETPNIVWASSKTAEPPSKLPIVTGEQAHDQEISAFGLTNFRGINHQFGLYRSDRGRHVYVIGQTGAGKSGLLELFALSDVFYNQGYAIIDPHGDFAVNNMRFIPPHRIKDVVYFNPADTAFPIGFNPMEVTDPAMRNNISSEIIGVLQRMFGETSWGPRLEYILRYTILALLYYPNSTMLDITRMLTDKKFREEVLTHVDDTVVLNFWRIEFASWNDKFASEAVAPVLNKVGAFTANPIIRNIIGQPKSTFNIREIMDEGKILIVNLSKGLIGEDNASILGSFIVTKIQLAAMSRSDIPNIEDRRPFYLYVDEFQNFATNSFATILSEARKYGLNLTVANQYVSQMSDTVRDAVFGNVGTMITFRISADDAPLLAKQFEPQFEAADLLQMHNRHFVISMVIKGEKAPGFSATTLTLPPAQTDYSLNIIENTRKNFASERAGVEEAIRKIIAPPSNLQKPQSSNMAKQWPIANGAKPAQNNRDQQRPKPAPQPQAAPATPEQAPQHPQQGQPSDQQQQPSANGSKRRRSRSRSRGRGPGSSTGGGNTGGSTPSSAAPQLSHAPAQQQRPAVTTIKPREAAATGASNELRLR
ncbi:hypothetical protein CYG49_04200 [Candidatus Saccharibacteria bacterium]|nr:MAG: hypothetical protein CYG49_04200 [Candidatus Saccharibacteria bacterium]